MPPQNRRPRRAAARPPAAAEPPVSLRTLADHLGLSPATISLVINRAPGARAIPKTTQDRVLAAARRFHYRPNSIARSLRAQRTFTVGVLVPEISEGYSALVMGGIEEHLLQSGYLYFVASHRHRADLIDEYPRLLLDRSIEGLDRDRHAVSAAAARAGRGGLGPRHDGGRDEHRARSLARGAGSRSSISCGSGTPESRSSRGRPSAPTPSAGGTRSASPRRELGVTIDPRVDRPARRGPRRRRSSATTSPGNCSAGSAVHGALRLQRRVGHRRDAARFARLAAAFRKMSRSSGSTTSRARRFQQPGLTTVRQPLRRMGELAAEIVVRRIGDRRKSLHAKQVMVEPELIVRGSSGRRARTSRIAAGRSPHAPRSTRRSC